jgi:hypothetical protein
VRTSETRLPAPFATHGTAHTQPMLTMLIIILTLLTSLMHVGHQHHASG